MDPLQYDDVCRYVGKLYLESNRQLEAQSAMYQRSIQDLTDKLKQANQERDDALKILSLKPKAPNVATA